MKQICQLWGCPPPALLIVLSGPSGVGKDTVLNEIRKYDLPVYYAVTSTTRARRPGEIDGFHYEFLTEREFSERASRQEFLEYANVYGNWYGSPKQPVREALAAGCDVLLKIDVQGARAVREQVPGALFLFLAPPSIEWLREHLRARKTESPQKLAERERAAALELEAADEFDYVVVNRDNDITSVVEDIARIVHHERRRRGQVQV